MALKVEKIANYISLLIGFLVPSNATFTYEGNIRHIKYLSEVFKIIYAPLNEVLFGYGFRGGGFFYNNYVSWLKEMNFVFPQGLNQESTLPSFILWGGVLGFIYWATVLSYIHITANDKIRILLLVMIFLMFGYYINSPIIYIIFFTLFLKNGDYKISKS